MQAVVAGRRLHLQQRTVGVRLEARDPVAPAQVDEARRGAGIHQPFLGVVLLQVHEGGVFVALLGQQVEAVGLALAVVHTAGVPGDAGLQETVAEAEPAVDLQRALGEADGARADGDGVVLIQQHARDAAPGEIERRGQPDQPAADDDHGRVLAAAGRRGREAAARGAGLVLLQELF